MDCEDSRCCDDFISGSPDQQDWSLISAGREGAVLIISHITGSYANNKKSKFHRQTLMFLVSVTINRLSHSLEKLVSVVEVHVLPDCVLYQRP